MVDRSIGRLDDVKHLRGLFVRDTRMAINYRSTVIRPSLNVEPGLPESRPRTRARAHGGGRRRVICDKRLKDEIVLRATEQDRLCAEVIRRY